MRDIPYGERLKVPRKKADVVLDTDAYNEIDDQFAIAYLMKSQEKLNPVAIYAAPFLNHKVLTPEEGMTKSYDEIKKVLDLSGCSDKKRVVYRGASKFLADESTPADAEAVRDLVRRAMEYTTENPLYVVGIAALTNIASALLTEPAIASRITVVWLGGNARHSDHNREFNIMQDPAAARVVFNSGVPLIQVPCLDVAEHFAISRPELEYWLRGKNVLCEYLTEITIREMETWAAELPWTKTIWDVTAVAWLLNEEGRFMEERLETSPVLEADLSYTSAPGRHDIKYVYRIRRDELMKDLIGKLVEEIRQDARGHYDDKRLQ